MEGQSHGQHSQGSRTAAVKGHHRQLILQQVEHGRDSKTKDIKETKKGGGGDTGCNKDCNKGGEQTLYEKHKEAFH